MQFSILLEVIDQQEEWNCFLKRNILKNGNALFNISLRQNKGSILYLTNHLTSLFKENDK